MEYCGVLWRVPPRDDLSSNLSELVDAEIDVEANDFGDDPSKGSSTS